MTDKIYIGKINQLMAERHAEPGLYLKAKNDEEVLLPNAYVSIKMEIGKTVDVFVYRDSEDRLVASTYEPYAKLGEFALMEVVDTAEFGAFCDWGMTKHLFVPKKYQKTPFRVGQKRVLRVCLDEATDRLIGVERFGKYISNLRPDYEKGESVELFIMAKTPLGFKAIINNRFSGMLFSNEIFEPLRVGDRKQGYIKQIRVDGKIDLSLKPLEKDGEYEEQKILDVLRKNDYFVKCNSKSSPEHIYEIFGLSKKTFKKALVSLQDKGVLVLQNDGIKFVIA